MIPFLSAATGVLGGLLAHDLAWQTLHERPLRPLSGICRRCGEPGGWWRIRCPDCGLHMGRDIAMPLIGGVVGLAFGIAIGASWILPAYLGMLGLTLALGVTDLAALRIVDRLNIPGTVMLIAALGAGSLLEGNGEAMIRALGGGLAYLAGTNLVFLVTRGIGFGYGDVKLSVQLGVFTAYWSWGTLGWAVLLTAVIGGVVSLVVLGLAAGKARRDGEGVRAAMKAELPYGPVMILGSWTAIVFAGLGAFPIPT